jgi:hypothetical protein
MPSIALKHALRCGSVSALARAAPGRAPGKRADVGHRRDARERSAREMIRNARKSMTEMEVFTVHRSFDPEIFWRRRSSFP